MLFKLKAELAPATPGVKPLCPTRWTVRAESLRSILVNYEVITALLEEILEEYKGNTEATCSARGILAMMEKFCFIFGITLGEKLFRITDTLSKALQKKDLSAMAAKKCASITVSGLKDLRSDSKFSEYWAEVTGKASDLGIAEPTLPRKRKHRRRFDESSSSTYHDDTPESMYKRYYFKILDTLVGEIERRFESETFTFYTKMELLLQSAAEGKELSNAYLQEVVDHFIDDLELSELRTELSLLKNVMANVEFTYTNLKIKICEYQAIFPQLMKLIQLLLVIPATSATSERSFSSLRNVKNVLRTTMKQDRLNHLLMIYIHKERDVDIKAAMKEFIQCNRERMELM